MVSSNCRRLLWLGEEFMAFGALSDALRHAALTGGLHIAFVALVLIQGPGWGMRGREKWKKASSPLSPVL